VPGDKIRLINMAFYGYHGVAPEEAVLGQKFFVDLEVALDLRRAGAADDVAETLDYRDLYRVVRETNAQRFNLLEGFAEALAQRVLREQPCAVEVLVRVRKPSVPLGGLLDHAEVEIVRRREA
jgi:dihydroneopterin aldolase